MEKEQICPKCGGQVIQSEALGGTGPLVVTKPRSALALGMVRASTVSARVCTACGYLELFAANPEVLK
jgi:predicted nucleic-acid-binding Zn-ribbon protein